MDNPILEAYSGNWIKLQLEIERKAQLKQLNMNHFHRTSIDPACLRRKQALRDVLTYNVSALAIWFTENKRSEAYLLQGRRMYRQYQNTLIRLKSQIEYIETWLDQSPPF